MTGRLDPGGFMAALDLLFEVDPGLRTRLQILSVADFREAVGPKWDRLADKVGWVADSIIRQHLSSHDLFTQADPDTFVIAMPKSGRDDSRRVMVRIAQGLSTRLLGDITIGGGRPLALAANIAFAEARDSGGGLNLHALRREVESSRSLVSPNALEPVRQGAAMEESVAASSLLSLMQGADRNGRAVSMAEAAAPEQAAADWRYFHSDRSGAAGDGHLPPMPPDARLALVWRPTWDSDSETIAAYAARVVRLDRRDAAPLEGGMAYSAQDVDGAILLDRFVIGRTVRDLRAAEALGRRISVIVPISWQSVTADSRGETMRPFADIDETLRRRRVKVEIFNLPDDAPPEQVKAVLDFLARIGCEVMVRRHLSSAEIPSLGIANVGLELAELRPDERVGDDELLARLDHLQRRAGEAGARCYLWGVRRRKVIASLVQGGFRMVNGPGLMEDVGRPAMVLPAPRQRLIAAA